MKKSNIVLAAALFLVFAIMSFTPTHSGTWELAKEKGVIKVYTRTSAMGSLKDSKGVMQVKSTVDDVLTLLRKFDQYSKWMYRCPESKLLKKVSEAEYYVYTVTDAPWPVTDRDLVTHVKAEQKPDGTIILNLSGVKDYIPVKPDRVRVPRFKGLWQVTPKTNGMVEITYQLESDPGGSLPDWVANATATDIPFFTLVEMKKLLEK